MRALLNLLPLVGFLLAYRLAGIYAATAVLMIAMPLLALLDYLRERRVSAMHGVTTVLVLLLGGATLVLHDPRFLKLKGTVLLWLLAAAFLGSQWLGKTPLAQRMLEPALPPGTNLSRTRWVRVNLLWAAIYFLLGALNLYVAHAASEQAWVHFKVLGLPIALAALVMAQALWL
ncbi:MAG: septation protein IspZ, partial [Gammaproteobacteria bacterium]|nr:septation protein IspZ [Gammaproteobacteria bacterium]